MTSIIMLSFNTLEYTRLAIASVREYTEPGTYELIIIDNASSDGSRKYLQTLAGEPDIRVVLNDVNAGFPAGCNQGMRLAVPDSDLLLLNSDVIVTPHWLENMQRALHSAPNIGAVGCVTNNCSNEQQLPVHYDDIDGMMAFARGFNMSDPAKWYPWLRLIGFCMLIRRAAYEHVGGLDERYSPGYYEDDDYSFTLRLAGYRLLLLQDTFIHHFGSASFNKAGGGSESPQFLHGQQEFYRKWQPPQYYNCQNDIVQDLPAERLRPGARVLVANAGWGGDVYHLLVRYPGLLAEGLTGSRTGVRLTRQDIGLQYAGAAERNEAGEVPLATAAVRRILAGRKYEQIVLIGDASRMPDIEVLLGEFVSHLAGGGHLRYGDAERVYEQTRRS